MDISTVEQDLKTRWAALRASQPHSYTRNDARALGVSEAELICTRLGEGVTRLIDDPKRILASVPSLGRVKTITRNDHMVLERKGAFTRLVFEGPVGLFVGEDIDLRIFWSHWGSAFAVVEGEGDQMRHSLQFFDQQGEAVHKIHMLPESDHAAFQRVVHEHKAALQEPVVPAPFVAAARPATTSSPDVAAFKKSWSELKDTHDFHLLLREHGLTRTQALELAPEGMAVKLSGKPLRHILTKAAGSALPIMIFVGNRGMLQIHTGTIFNVVDARGWLNVLDPDLDLHVREEAITSSWVVTKPTRDGLVTALECYDSNGELLIQLFGKRKPGIPELPEWRSLLEEMMNTMRA